jgi:hypothetical protein
MVMDVEWASKARSCGGLMYRHIYLGTATGIALITPFEGSTRNFWLFVETDIE